MVETDQNAEEQKAVDLMELLTTPTLKWLDIEKCDKILKAIEQCESEQAESEVGVF